MNKDTMFGSCRKEYDQQLKIVCLASVFFCFKMIDTEAWISLRNTEGNGHIISWFCYIYAN